MGLLKAAWEAIRKAPVAKWIKPLWKTGLKEVVQIAGDALQASIKAEVSRDLDAAPGKLQALIAGYVAQADALLTKAHVPAWAREKCNEWLKQGAGELQSRLSAALSSGSAGAVNDAIDLAFDAFQAKLIERIAAL